MKKTSELDYGETRRLLGNYFYRHWILYFCLIFLIEVGIFAILHDVAKLCSFQYSEHGINYEASFMGAVIGTMCLHFGIKDRQAREAKKAMRLMTQNVKDEVSAK